MFSSIDLDQFNCYMFSKDMQGRYLEANNSWLDLLGLKQGSDIVGKTDADWFPEYMARLININDMNVINNCKLGVYLERVVDAHNELRLLVVNKRLEKSGKSRLVCFAVDVTEVIGDQFEDCELLSKIINVMPGNIYWKDREGVLLGCNDNNLRYLGLSSRKDFAGKTNYELLDEETADFVHKVDMEVIQSGEPQHNIEEPCFNQDGCMYLTQKEPLFDDSENVIGVVGISFDITERKNLEKQLQEARLLAKSQEERINTLKIVSASLAHELRTPLAAIRNFSHLAPFIDELLDAYNKAQEAKLDVAFIRPSQQQSIEKAMGIIGKEAGHAQDVINALLSNLKELEVSRDEYVNCSIKECMLTVVDEYNFSNKKQKDLLHIDLDNDFTFLGTELLVAHVLSNLLKNALYYVAKAGKGDIKVWLVSGDKFNELHFRDTGTGIPAADLPQVFDQFFSKTENGTGIGLSFSRMAMQNIGGDMECYSKEGEFTEFVLLFPCVK